MEGLGCRVVDSARRAEGAAPASAQQLAPPDTFKGITAVAGAFAVLVPRSIRDIASAVAADAASDAVSVVVGGVTTAAAAASLSAAVAVERLRKPKSFDKSQVLEILSRAEPQFHKTNYQCTLSQTGPQKPIPNWHLPITLHCCSEPTLEPLSRHLKFLHAKPLVSTPQSKRRTAASSTRNSCRPALKPLSDSEPRILSRCTLNPKP